ncbi:MAG: nucleotide exchange factor GrpE [Holosporaceae bacterium]|jgi:molecular chaperone GrpE|nr:nucleotide exchange factor GrpE [Holosporaceae bacterium]
MSEDTENQEDNVEKNVPADQIGQLEAEINTLKDTFLRKIAESDNLRKRLEKEKEDAIRFSNTRFARDLLTVADNLERVTENSATIREKIETEAGLKIFFDGVLLCEKELVSIFSKYGISRIAVKIGDGFNPEYHQAMCEEESSDYEAGVVLRIMQVGYTYHGRLLRPAMVSVSKKI